MDIYAAEEQTCEEQGKLSEIKDSIRGCAQTTERLGTMLDDFLRRCCGPLPQTTAGDAVKPTPIAPSHFHKIDDATGRLAAALKYLETRVSRLSEIG